MKKDQKNRVLILGGAGYVGSRLWHYLKEQGDYILASWDLEWFGKPDSVHNHKYDICDITRDYIEDVDVVVLLAGHSSVQMCHQNYHSAWSNNVNNFMHLSRCMRDDQKLIYASSSSVYGHWPEQFASETGGFGEPVNPYDHTKQTIDQITKMQHNSPCQLGKPIPNVKMTSNYANIYGLRFGTVNGYSQNFRTDVMINAMWHSAKTKREVSVFNGATRRSILGIQDLCRAIHTIIEKGVEPKIYNLASFHSTSLDIGKTVANIMDVQCVESTPVTPGNEKMTTKNYDFWVSTDAFCSDFDFEFLDSIGSIVEDINYGMAESKLKGIRTIQKPRNKHIQYG